MKIAKSVVAGLVAMASFALVAACGDKGGADTAATPSSAAPSPSSSPTKSLSAAEQFSAATAKTSGSTYSFKAAQPDTTYDGAADPVAGVSAGKLTVSTGGAKVVIETQLSSSVYYLKISGLPVPGLNGSKWLKADPAKIKAKTLGSAKDPLGLADLNSVVSGVQSADGKQFKGTIDLTKMAAGPVDEETVKGLGDKAKAVPFEATVDDKGYLSALKISLPAYGQTKAGELTVAFSDFGSPVTVTPPTASDVVDAPASLYAVLNG